MNMPNRAWRSVTLLRAVLLCNVLGFGRKEKKQEGSLVAISTGRFAHDTLHCGRKGERNGPDFCLLAGQCVLCDNFNRRLLFTSSRWAPHFVITHLLTAGLSRTRRSSPPPSSLRVNTVKYNRFHDQLLVSGSSDCLVHLWRVSSVSSAPLLEPEDDDDDAGGLGDDSDAGDAGGYGGGGSGSKGEAADIRVSFFASEMEFQWSFFAIARV